MKLLLAVNLENKFSCVAACEILVLVSYAQKPPLNAHANVFNRARYLKFGLVFDSLSTSILCECQ